MNKNIFIVFITALCLGACICTNKKIDFSAAVSYEQESEAVSETPSEPVADEDTPQTDVPASTPQAPVSQPVAKQNKPSRPVAKANEKKLSAADEPDSSDIWDIPEEITLPAGDTAALIPQEQGSSFTPQKAAQLIAQKRAAQTLSAPVADVAVFKDEKLIPLENRRLGPLAYEPLQKDTSTAQWRGEQLKFGVYYSFVKAGTAYIKNRGLTEVNGRKAFLIETTAFSATVIDSVFKVRDVNYSWIDAQTFKSLGYTQSLREGNYVRDEWLAFDIANHRYYGEIQKKEEPRVIAGELTEEVLDMLSSLYYVRTQPLEVGKDIIFDIVNREKQYPLVVKVLKKETVKTAAGKFNCWVVEPKFRGEGIFVAKGKSLKVWLTADEYKMPVKMQAEVFIGSVKAELLEYRRN